jgi:hypothetical protein
METTHLASLCQHADLIGIVTDSWIEVVNVGNASYIKLAINIAEQYGLSSVRGRAYYAMMILDRGVWDQTGVLTIPQRLRLLSGFYHLAQRCHLLEKQPPEITHCACIPTTHSTSLSSSAAHCKAGWIHLWKMIFTLSLTREKFILLSPADFIGRLSFIAVFLEVIHDRPLGSTVADRQMAAGCLKLAVAKVRAMSEECTRSLPDIFVDLT